MTQSSLKYKKWRAFARWLYQSFIICVIVGSFCMLLMQIMELSIAKIHVPDERKPITYIMVIMLTLITRSFTLIRDLEKIEQDATTPKEKTSQIEQIEDTELDRTFPDKIMDSNHQLKVSMSAFVRYCVQNEYYPPYTIKAWSPVGDKIYSMKGKKISSKQLAQAYQDLITKGSL